MRVLAVMGSPRKLGNTYKATKLVEEQMHLMGDVEFEYVFLKDLNLGMCRGCRLCMDKGEQLCPLKDDRALLEQKMLAADGVIFASPTYVGNVSGLMKNFIDRLCYACHRPRFFRNALLLTTSGGGGGGFMLLAFGIAIESVGFKVVHKAGVVMHERPDWGTPLEREKLEAEKLKKTGEAARNFYLALKAGEPKPGVADMARFSLTRKAHLRDEPGSPDYRYWKEHGWYENDVFFYYGPKPGIIKKGLIGVTAAVFSLAAR